MKEECFDTSGGTAWRANKKKKKKRKKKKEKYYLSVAPKLMLPIYFLSSIGEA